MSIGSFAVVPKTVENQVMDVTNQILLTHFFCKRKYIPILDKIRHILHLLGMHTYISVEVDIALVT